MESNQGYSICKHHFILTIFIQWDGSLILLLISRLEIAARIMWIWMPVVQSATALITTSMKHIIQCYLDLHLCPYYYPIRPFLHKWFHSVPTVLVSQILMMVWPYRRLLGFLEKMTADKLMLKAQGFLSFMKNVHTIFISANISLLHYYFPACSVCWTFT